MEITFINLNILSNNILKELRGNFFMSIGRVFDSQEERSAISQPRVLIMSRSLNSGPPDKKGRSNSANVSSS